MYACSTPQLVRAYPRQTAVRALYLVLYAGAIVACSVLFPWLLVPFGIVAIAGALTGLWLQRPDAGRRERLPPGALTLIPVRQFTDEEFLTRQIERHGPVSKTTLPTLNSPTVCVHGLRRGSDVLREHGSRLAAVGIAFDPLIPARFLRNMEPGDHRYYKRVFEKAFSDSVVGARRDDFGAAVRGGLEALAAASRSSKGADPRAYLQRTTVAAFAPLFLGVERGTQEFGRVAEIYEAMGEFVEPRAVDSAQGRWYQEAAGELEQILRRSAGEISATLSSGREPPPSFLAEIVRALPDALEDRNVTLNLVFLLRTASADVASLLHWIMKTLGDHPEWGRLARESGAGDVADRIVLETLRLHQSEFIQRRVLEPFEVDGFTVPGGWHLRVCVHESHRDPAIFPDPDAFDPDRFAGRRFSRYEYSPFGRLEHRCIGVSTTISLAACFVTRLSGGYDWAVVRDGPPEFNRYHWRPSRRFRVRLEPREQATV
jgi:cytochrome P450